MNYYNEINKFAAQWLRNLIAAGHIAPGIVDERSIEDVRPDDLRGFTQCHFFAGIGVWSYALRRAGWPDDRPVWTGSCPCQPFSQAGEGSGFDDERHLWPHFHWLIQERRPAAILGEQVASKDAEPWINLVHADLEGLGYAFGAVPFPSASVGAPHIRDRLFWVANANGSTGRQRGADIRGRFAGGHAQSRAGSGGSGLLDGLAHNDSHGRSAQPIAGVHHTQRDAQPCGSAGGLGHTDSERAGRDGRGVCGQGASGRSGEHSALDADAPSSTRGLANPGCLDAPQVNAGNDPLNRQRAEDRRGAELPTGPGAGGGTGPRNYLAGCGGVGPAGEVAGLVGPGPTNGFWRDADWLLCRDGKWRPVEPGTFPLAHGASSRVGRLRAYGNAINAEAARVFIETVMEPA